MTLLAKPFGFFCLNQTWQSNARSDYSLIPILENRIPLSTGTRSNGKWYLTPNGVQVAAHTAIATGSQGLKTLVFTQTIPWVNSAINTINASLGPSACILNAEEIRMHAVVSEELGGKSRLYIEINPDGMLISSSVCHHGLLLPYERLLHESLFKRPDGINVMVATSTVAQGMNLPSEVVIIAGDSRFDQEADKMQQLEAHELLNAAGRAGRAGDRSYGFVLLVPSKVIDFDDASSVVHQHWEDLRVIFSQSDQCLEIEDPLAHLLDQIHLESTKLSPLSYYLLKRLPVDKSSDDGVEGGAARRFLSKSLGAYRARARGDVSWIETRIEAAVQARRADPETPAELTWADHLAAATGIPVGVIRELGNGLSKPIHFHASMSDWYRWMVEWLTWNPQLIPILIRRESLEQFFGSQYVALQTDQERGTYALPLISKMLTCWMAGDTLEDLERVYGTTEQKIGKCESAREFVLRIVPELAFIFGTPAQIFRALKTSSSEAADPPLGLAVLGSCVKEGFDRIEKLALQQIIPGRASRREVHREYLTLQHLLNDSNSNEDFGNVIGRVKNAFTVMHEL